MLSREQILSILGAMDQSKLVSALSAVGVDVGDGTGMDPMSGMGPEQTEGLQSWNDRPMEIKDSPRPPLTVRADASQMPAKPTPDYLKSAQATQQQDLSDLNDFMPQEYMAQR